MDQLFTFILLLLNLSGTLTKYIYVEQKMDWLEAQSYCRQNYTDLAPVSTEKDVNKLKQLSRNVAHHIWIGLVRNSPGNENWRWSGGEVVSRNFWAEHQPDNCQGNEDRGCMQESKWYDATLLYQTTFFCYSAEVVMEEKTWEEALEYCRERYKDLASVASETEKLLIQKELNKLNTTEIVWIGLRFLPGDWLWVDGQEMDYKAWGQGEKPMCPPPKMKCGALQVTGANKGAWEARDCEERLHFVCY
ncbi:macrophage mannose receptor 1-like [Simochromis diagramma]|uniref:macrophage mannose receptor 1-like n=1 Tax=Simochromis diagramma TaxID=43689 RepID=UPI001A7E22F8|nr:macrophage mannose receptor 1-like [Simochromis diagramma]